MEQPTQKAESPAAPKVAVTNTSRNQPVLFHFVGGSMRLGPLETRELDRGCLASPELSHLILTGAVRMAEPLSPAADPPLEA